MKENTAKAKLAIAGALFIIHAVLIFTNICDKSTFVRPVNKYPGVLILYFLISIKMPDKPVICAFISAVGIMLIRAIKIPLSDGIILEESIAGKFIYTNNTPADLILCAAPFLLIVLVVKMKAELHKNNVSFIKALLTFLSFPFFIFAFIIPVLAEKPIISLVVIIFALITMITVRIKVRGVRQMMSASAYLFLMSQVIIMSYVYTIFMTIADNGGFQH